MKHYLGRTVEGGTLLSFIRGCIEIVQCDRTLLDRERRGCRRRLLLDYFNVFKKGGYSVTWMVSCRKAVPQAPSLGRFDVLLLSFEVEKCGLCFLFVGEKYGEIDKKLICARARVCVCVCSPDKNEYLCRVVRLLEGKKWDVFFNQNTPPPTTPPLPPSDFDTPSDLHRD